MLEDLNAILLRSIEKGIDQSFEKQIKTISKLRDQIIAAYSSKGDIEWESQVTLAQLPPEEAEYIRTVDTFDTLWNAMTPYAQIKVINKRRLPLKNMGMTASQAAKWLIKSGDQVFRIC